MLFPLLAGCADYANRTYRYAEEIPVKPFVFKLKKTEYHAHDQTVEIKIFLEVSNHSTDRTSLTRQRFTLRVGSKRELTRKITFLESLGSDAVRFSPGEQIDLVLPFTLTKEDLLQNLALIVDRRELKTGKTQWTLIQVKDGSFPGSFPPSNDTRVVRSAHWN